MQKCMIAGKEEVDYFVGITTIWEMVPLFAAEFAAPKPEYGMHPFWFWNGRMEDREIVAQIEAMAEQGIGGFFICPRQGMDVPYLSDLWFRKVKLAVETAERFRMEVWLYDEYPYPSGIAGGEVILEHPEAKHRTLVHAAKLLRGGEHCSLELPWARLLYARAVPVDERSGERLWDRSEDVSGFIGTLQAEPVFQMTGLTAYNNKRFFTYRTVKMLEWTPPSGVWEVHCFLEKEIGDFKYYGTYVDPCHAEAMRTFIALTHERYTEAIGEHYGKTVKGMFTDETGLLGRMPWSPELPAFFKETFGYDLVEKLPALLYDIGKDTAKVRYDYFQAVHLLLRQSYHGQMSEWCETNGLQYVAEVPSVRMTTQLYSHVPGGDSAHDKLGRPLGWAIDQYFLSYRSNPKTVSGLSNQLGRERALIECFHSVGWSMTLQDAKWMIDRMAAMGINFFNPHAFFYTLNGLTKHDAPPSQFWQNPYWKHYLRLSDYVKRISYMMSRGQPIRPVAVLDPAASIWTLLGNPFHRFRYFGSDAGEEKRLERIKQDWLDICKAILLACKDYDPLDTELLAEAEVADGEIRIGNGAYKVLVLPPMTALEKAAVQQIQRFLEQGGTVIAAGLLPYERIEEDGYSEASWLALFGLEESPASSYWEESSGIVKPWSKGAGNAYFLPMGEQKAESLRSLLALIDQHSPSPISFEAANGSKSFLLQLRRCSKDTVFVFVTNQEGEEQEGILRLDGSLLWEDGSAVRIRRLHLETGEMETVQLAAGGTPWTLPVSFAPYESHAFLAERVESAGETEQALAEKPSIWSIPAGGNWRVNARQPNAIRFDTFTLFIDSGEGFPEAGENVGVKPFVHQLEEVRGSQGKLPLQFTQIFGTPKRKAIQYPLVARYTATFRADALPSSCCLVKDRGAISGEYRIELNGHAIVEEDYQPVFLYDNSNQACDIASLLQAGENTLAVEVTVSHDWDGLTDALYLFGDFGVQFAEEGCPVMVPLPEKAALSGGPYEGFPYYAGELAFSKDVQLAELPEGDRFQLVFTEWDPNFHDCAEVLINGRTLGVRPWTPYVWEGDRALLQAGANRIEVRVTNTLAGLLEGKWFDYEAHQLQPVQAKFAEQAREV